MTKNTKHTKLRLAFPYLLVLGVVVAVVSLVVYFYFKEQARFLPTRVNQADLLYKDSPLVEGMTHIGEWEFPKFPNFIIISATNKYLAIPEYEDYLYTDTGLWLFSLGNEIDVQYISIPIEQPLTNIEFSSSEEYMLIFTTALCGNSNECVYLWSLNDKKIIGSFEYAEFVAFADQEYLRGYEVGEGSKLYTLPELKSVDLPFPLSDARLFNPDFSMFVTSDQEGLVQLWNAQNVTLKDHFVKKPIGLRLYLEFSSDSKWLFANTTERNLLHIAESQLVQIGFGGRPRFSGDSTSYYYDDKLWSLPDRTVLREFEKEKFVDFYGTSSNLLLINANGALTLTDTSNSKEIVLLEQLNARIITLSPNDGLLAALTEHKGENFLDIWQISLQ